MKADNTYFLHPRITLRNVQILFLLSAVAVTLQNYFGGHMNNYFTFTRPVLNLLSCKSLYEYYGDLYDDFYRYSPTFALLAGMLRFLHDGLGLLIWNLLNTLVFIWGISTFLKSSGKTDRSMIIALLFVYLEWLISCQNSQSNALIAGLILGGATLLKKEKPFWAALLFSICFFIKFYGFAGAIVFLFYPRKIQFLLSLVFWFIVLSLLPLLATNAECFEMQYRAWIRAIRISPAGGRQLSVMGILKSWFGLTWSFLAVQVSGLLITLAPLVRFKLYTEQNFRNLILASVLIFLIIFNHMAESPTYVIALTGAAIWLVSTGNLSILDKIMVVLMLIFCSNSNSDLFPLSFRTKLLNPYSIKALPCLLVWLRIQYLLWLPAERLARIS